MQIVSGGFRAPEPATSQRAEIPQPLKSSSSYSQAATGNEASGDSLSDTVTISSAASSAAVINVVAGVPGDVASPDTADSPSDTESDYDAELIRELEARDLEVRNHERAHASTGGELAGAASYSFQRGPDGARYAVEGEVSIDVSEVPGDPAATYDKMARVRRAALAPAEPSVQDQRVAAMATQKMSEAQAELAAQQREELELRTQSSEQRREDMRSELEQARQQQNKDDESKDGDEEFVSVADQFAEYNARLRQINETLLRISAPSSPVQGSLLDENA